MGLQNHRGKASLALLLLLIGCAQGQSRIYTKAELGGARLQPSTTVAVVTNQETVVPELSDALAAEALKALKARGFQPATYGTATYLLLFDYGTVEIPRPQDYVGLWAPRYNHYLRVSVIQGEAYRSDETIEVVWRGQAQLANTQKKNPYAPTDLLKKMLSAALKNFGRQKTNDVVWIW